MKLAFASALLVCCLVLHGNPREGEFEAALSRLGGQVTFTDGGYNRSIPLNNLILERPGWGPVINPPMTGTYHITMPVAVDVQAVALWQHKRPGAMRQIKSFDVLLDGQLVKENCEIPRDQTQKETRFDLDGRTAKTVSIRIRELYPQEGKEAAWGGFDRVHVYSKTDLSELMSPPEEYTFKPVSVTTSHDWTAPKTYTVVKNVEGNPCLQWDAEELAAMRKELASNTFMQEQVAQGKSQLAGLLKKPPVVPKGEKNEEGEYIHVSDRKLMLSGETWGRIHNQLAVNALTAAMLWRLTDDAPCRDLAKAILMGYVKEYPNYRVGARPGFSHDPSVIFDQRLSDSTWLIMMVRAYDLIYDEFTAEERKDVEDVVLKANAKHIAGNRSHLISATNWAVISTAAILLTGYATHDADLVDIAENGWTNNKGGRQGGYKFQFKNGIGDDMLWKEGAMGYQGMALQGLITMAETLRHHGVDMYAANDGALKKLFDSELIFSYPNYVSPAIHDSGAVSIFNWNDTVWEYAYDNYRDPAYLPILKGITRWFPTRFQIFVSTTKYTVPDGAMETSKPLGSINFDSVGYAVLRLNGGDPFLLLDYGPHGSHSHLDKLNLDIFSHGEQLAADPGSAWYETAEYKEWYSKSFAHNLLIVDEQDQSPAKGMLVAFGGDEKEQHARAVCDEAVSGVMQDRSVYMTDEYIVDIFGAFSRLEHTYDLVWHLRGKPSLPDVFKPLDRKFENGGYRMLTGLSSCETKASWTAEFTAKGQTFTRLEHNKMTPFQCGTPGHVTRFIVPEVAEPTEYVTGHGVKGEDGPLTIFARRRAKSTVFCTVIDISGRNAVLDVKRGGDGLSTWVEVVTAAGRKRYGF